MEMHKKDGSKAGNSLCKLAESFDKLAEEDELEDFVIALMEIVANCAKQNLYDAPSFSYV